MRLKSVLFILPFTFLLVLSCKKEKPEETVAFNKGTMLKNVSSNIILPALNDFDEALSDLQVSLTTFSDDRTNQHLDEVKNNWRSAYLIWQTVKIFDFGPIRNNGFKGATGTYPTDTAEVDENIQNGTYNLASASNVDAIGLSALDYLLYQADALSKFQNDENYVNYTTDLVEKLKNESTTVLNQWQSYQSTFDSSTGTSSTSAFSELVNEFNRDYELAKTAKVGIPLGKKSLEIQMPEYIEARYSGISFELLNESVNALKHFFQGNSYESNNTGIGFDDYLVHLEKESLKNTINTNFDGIISKINGFSNTFEEEMQQNTAELDELYLLLQEQVVYIKTDMTSAFGVLITYQDNDGD
ncbi:MAG: imelysin family protein [Brumimicrobium sp.]